MKADLTLPVLDLLPDGSYSSVLISPKIRAKARAALLDAARAGQDLDEGQAPVAIRLLRSVTAMSRSERV